MIRRWYAPGTSPGRTTHYRHRLIVNRLHTDTELLAGATPSYAQ